MEAADLAKHFWKEVCAVIGAPGSLRASAANWVHVAPSGLSLICDAYSIRACAAVCLVTLPYFGLRGAYAVDQQTPSRARPFSSSKLHRHSDKSHRSIAYCRFLPSKSNTDSAWPITGVNSAPVGVWIIASSLISNWLARNLCKHLHSLRL